MSQASPANQADLSHENLYLLQRDVLLKFKARFMLLQMAITFNFSSPEFLSSELSHSGYAAHMNSNYELLVHNNIYDNRAIQMDLKSTGTTRFSYLQLHTTLDKLVP